MYEDQVFYAKVSLRAPVFVSNECWDRYRQHSDSVCSLAGQLNQVKPEHVRYLQWLSHYLLDQGYEGTKLWNVLRKELQYHKNSKRLSLTNISRYIARRSRKVFSLIATKV
jgi:hypothetical protein